MRKFELRSTRTYFIFICQMSTGPCCTRPHLPPAQDATATSWAGPNLPPAGRAQCSLYSSYHCTITYRGRILGWRKVQRSVQADLHLSIFEIGVRESNV